MRSLGRTILSRKPAGNPADAYYEASLFSPDGADRGILPAFTPAEWLHANGLAADDVTAPSAPLRSALAAQLGAPWLGFRYASTPVRTFLALVACHALRVPGAASDRRRLGAAMVSADDQEVVMARFATAYMADGAVLDFIDGIGAAHGFEHVAAVAAIMRARSMSGPLPSSDFLWLRRIDRSLWHAVNNAGRTAFHVEGAGAISHLEHETAAGASIAVPQVDEAIHGLQDYLARHGTACIDGHPEAERPSKARNAPGVRSPAPDNRPFLLGFEKDSGNEIWMSDSECLRHFIVYGASGSAKTEVLQLFAANAMASGSGFLLCDGKGDVTLFDKVYALARRFGREDDVLVLNYMAGNKNLGSRGKRTLSNTFNPFASAAPETMTQIIVDLMDDAGCDGPMWKARATAMLTGVTRALKWMHDRDGASLDASAVRAQLSLRQIIRLAEPREHPDMPDAVRKSIRSYLSTLPGYREDKGDEQPQVTFDQHGYLEMQFTKILGSLTDTYRHVFITPQGEIDMADVVLNRRILVVTMPALEKCGDEIANAGRIVVATLKGMMGEALGSEVAGEWSAAAASRRGSSPFFAILDDVSRYAIGDMDLMAAQARALGISMVLGGGEGGLMRLSAAAEAAPTELVLSATNPGDMHLVLNGKASLAKAPFVNAEGNIDASRLRTKANQLVRFKG